MGRDQRVDGQLGRKRPAARRVGRRRSKGWDSFAMSLKRFGMDKSTVGGLLIALLGIIFGLILDGGKVAQLIQPTAALIVFGGTIGAVMIQFPLRIVFQAVVHLKDVFFNSEPESDAIVGNLLRYAYKARREGILSLDSELSKSRILS
jgi:flagellar motor component MotA